MARSASPDVASRAGAGPAGESSRRVVLLAGDRRLDVAVPAHLPLAEVLSDLRDLAARAGARAPAGTTLVRAGSGPLASGLSLAEQEVSDGDLLVLQAPQEAVPLLDQSDLASAVRASVGADRSHVSAGLREATRVATATTVGLLLALAPAVLGVVGVPASVLVLGFAVRAVTTAAQPGRRWWGAAGALLMTVHAIVLGSAVAFLASGHGGAPWPPGTGAALGAAASCLVLLWAPVRLRPWALVPGVLALGFAARAATDVVLAPGTAEAVSLQILPAAAVLLVLLAAPLRALAVDLTLVRATPPPGTAFRVGEVRERVRGAESLLLAGESATAIVACAAVPTLVTSGAGVLLWLALVLLLALRARDEEWAVRWIAAVVSAGALLAWGMAHLLLVSSGSGSSGSAPWVWCGAVLLVLGGVALHPGSGRDSSVWLRRSASVGERLLRVALPSLWLLQSGILEAVQR